MAPIVNRQALPRVIDGDIKYHCHMEGRPRYDGHDTSKTQVFDRRPRRITDASNARLTQTSISTTVTT